MKTNGNGHSDSHKSPEELEREIEAERAHIVDTLEALEQKFSPGEIVDQALSYARRHGGDLSRNFVSSVTQNPVPALMTAVGVLWMMYGQNHPGARVQPYSSLGRDDDWGEQASASYGVDPDYGTGSSTSSGSSKTQQLKDRATHFKDDLKRSAHDTRARASSKTHELSENMHARGSHIKDSAQQRAQQVSNGFNYMVREQPLALGAIGIALGSLLGASMPVSERERVAAEKTRERLNNSNLAH